jgi:hypothetical protein
VRVARPIFVSATLAAGAACSLFTDFSGLDDPPAGVDAAADTDVTSNDATSENVTAIDASTDVDGAVGCPSGSFCDDFNEGMLGAKWNDLTVEGTGVVAFDEKDFQSAPRSLRTTVDGSPNTTTRTAYLRRNNLTLAKKARCTFDVRVNGTGEADYHVDFFQFKAAGPQIQNYSLRLYLLDDESAMREDFVLSDGGCLCPKQYQVFNAIPRNKWTKVVVETDFNEATVYYDGALVFKKPFGGFTPSTLGVVVGIQTYSRFAWDVQYDDVRCDPIN